MTASSPRRHRGLRPLLSILAFASLTTSQAAAFQPLPGESPFDALGRLFEQAAPATLAELPRLYTGRIFQPAEPRKPLGGVLVADSEGSSRGPLFQEAVPVILRSTQAGVGGARAFDALTPTERRETLDAAAASRGVMSSVVVEEGSLCWSMKTGVGRTEFTLRVQDATYFVEMREVKPGRPPHLFARGYFFAEPTAVEPTS